MLLGEGDWREDAFAQQLPRVLGPMGIECFHARSARAAAEVAAQRRIHIAVVDISIPMEEQGAHAGDAGAKVLQLLRRMEAPPAIVVVRPPQPSAREASRFLGQALREGAFAVLDRPLQLEAMLQVLRRILHRHYAGAWPQGPAQA